MTSGSGPDPTEELNVLLHNRTRYFVGIVVALVAIVGTVTWLAIATANNSTENTVAERSLQQEVQALKADFDAVQANAVASAKANVEVSKEFLSELNFICSVEEAQAKQLGLPPPSPGTCSLQLPSP